LAQVEREGHLLARPRMSWQRDARDPDAEFVRAAQQDPERFVALYDRYVQRIQNYIRTRVANSAAADDAISQTFLTALIHLPRFEVRDGGSFAAWLFRIAHNVVYDLQRHPGDRLDHDHDLTAAPDTAPGPEAHALARDRAVDLQRALGHLRPAQQHLLALRYGAELEIDEIAALLGKSAGAVRVGIHRALRDLRGRYSHDDE